MRTKWWIVKSPIEKYAKVKDENLHLIPKTWKIIPRTLTRYYKKDGRLQEKTHGLAQIKRKSELKLYESYAYYDFHITIGRIFGL